ncbi:MAG: carboxypeptidase-like regulatory domain-containing protein [Tenuifilum sp.]|uniref:carboxypeptidase-like regulatory domain-containing protein n=1 Tax=Tenuifilum sp. TaxID=2760880 RepID=UPI002B5FA32B|nr:carboxypeptidase-like regulatory domain-containing protein [Tenuifilum sp.]HOK85526.1 carboxypeptidase-like regulatory domain-containing protein [Tenuifilum sp.]HON69662.1 carboxypeptidase-like regulatory domain-containing protein [Tenuifilum sp.]HPP89171.1 carboxypeptidase-like regulatory domain-containing protein [Tenuifilum sp.]
MKKLLFLFAVFLFSKVSAQTIIEGYVSDFKGKPIDHAQIVLYSTSGSGILSYAFVNTSGYYKITTSKQGDFRIEYLALGFNKIVKFIKIPLDSALVNPIRIDVTLEEQAYEISEVIKHGDKPITIKTDTIVYNVKSFTNGTERVVEDVLKKLPGINVDDNGRVTFKGKEVEKVMVEQTDFFGKGYRMITQRVHANAIEKVEAISNYSENPILKEISNSDKVALNLKLTENSYKKIYTNFDLGYNTINKHDINVSLMNFNRVVNSLIIGNSNSIGDNPTVGSSELFKTLSETSDDKLTKADSPDFILTQDAYRPILKRQRVNDIDLILGSMNEAVNLSKKTKLTVTTVYSNINDKFIRQTLKNYSYDTLSIINTENYNFYMNNKNAFIKSKIESSPSNKSFIQYNFLFSSTYKDANTLTDFNQTAVGEEGTGSSFKLINHLNFSQKINNRTIAYLIGYTLNGNLKEELMINPIPITHLSTIGSIDGRGKQKLDNDYCYFLGVTGIKHRISNMLLIEGEVGANIISYDLKSSYVIIDSLNNNTPDPSFLGNTNINSNEAFLQSKLIWGSDSLNISLGYKICLNKIYEKQNNYHYKRIILLPNITFKWLLNRINTLSLFYNSDIKPFPYTSIINHYYFNSYNSINRGTFPSLMNMHNLGASYLIGKLNTRFFMNSSLMYIYESKFITQNIEPNINYVVSKDTITKNRNTIIGNIEANYFIKLIRSNIKFSLTSLYFDYDNFLFGISNRNRNNSTTLAFEIRSSFNSFLNFHSGYSITQGRIVNKKTKQNNIERIFCNLYIKPSQNLSLDLLSELYSNQSTVLTYSNNSYFLINSKLTYNFPNTKWSMSFSTFNILNDNNYVVSSISEYYYSKVSYNLIPRYFMFSVSFKY